MGWRAEPSQKDWATAVTGIETDLAIINTATMAEATAGLKEELRDQVRRAGLGERAAKTWQAKVYPQSGRPSLDPAGYVYSKWPKVIDAYDKGATIYPHGGRRWLALPTENTPRKPGRGHGRKGVMTPVEVEAAFNQDLIIRPARNPRHRVAFVNAVSGLNRRGVRAPTGIRMRGRRGLAPRQLRLVLMFTLVPFTFVTKGLDYEGAATRWAQRIPAIMDKHWR